MATPIYSQTVDVKKVSDNNVPGWDSSVEPQSFTVALNADGKVKTFSGTDGKVKGIICTSNETPKLKLYFYYLSKLSNEDKKQFTTKLPTGEDIFYFENVVFGLNKEKGITLQDLAVI